MAFRNFLHLVFFSSVFIHGLGAVSQFSSSRHEPNLSRSAVRTGTFAVNVTLVLVSIVSCTRWAQTGVDSAVATHLFASSIGVTIGSIISLLIIPFSHLSLIQAAYELSSCVIWATLLILEPAPDWIMIAIPALYLTSLIATVGTPWTPPPSDDLHHPLSSAPFLSTCTLSWLDPLLKLAASRTLSSGDCWPVDSKLSVRSTLDYRSSQPTELRQTLYGGLLTVLWRNFKAGILSSFLLALANVVAALTQPFFLQSLITNCDILSVVGLFSTSLMAGMTEAHMKLILRRIGLQLRSALTAILCDGCIEATDRKESGPDPAVLIEVDSAKVFDLVEQYHLLWMVPVQSAISVAALVMLLGWKSVLAGFISPVVAMPLLTFTTSRISQRMTDIIEAKDSRVALITQVIKQIEQIKLGALQYLFERKIDEKRVKELEKYKSVAMLNAYMVFLVYVLPPALISITFGTSILLGQSLTSDLVFPALAFCFNITRSVSLVPRLVMLYQAGRISFNRIRDFLLASEDEGKPIDSQVVLRPFDLQSVGPVGFRMHTCDITLQGAGKVILQDCNMEASSGSLLAISGPVGCGKTTLIRSIVGEIKPPFGDIHVQGRIAYAPQKPFIICGTVRDNILFGLPFDGHFYKKVVEAVALDSDLVRLPAGDETMLGGTGVGLSGGQKSRIGLARAVYSQREVIVLDDPLAAVDAKVRSHLISRVLGPRGILKNALRIVTTSSEALISQADKIYAVKNGTLVEAIQPSPVRGKVTGDILGTKLQDPSEPDRSPPTFTHYGSIKKDSSVWVKSPESEDDTERTPLLPKTCSTDSHADTGDAPVRFETYLRFLKLSKHGGWIVVFLTASASKLLDVLAVYFLKLSSQEFESQGHSSKLAYYSVCALIGGFFSSIFVLIAYFLCVIPSSHSIHTELTKGILESKFSFFDTTSLGQILNRFTNDINKIDTSVSGGLISLVALCVTATASILVIAAATPLSILYLAPIGGIYYSIQAYYLHACRQLRRLETLARGPILNTAHEMMVGASIIKTFDQDNAFKDKARDVIDDHIRVWAPFIFLDSWLVLRLQLLSSIIQLLSAGLLLWLHTPASTLGLVMNYQIQITSQFNSFVQIRATLEADITAAERVWSCAANPPESQADDEAKARIQWQQRPAITFNSYSASYKPNDRPCLRNLDFTIQPGEHVAVVGRTGAGKSSLVLALLRALHRDVLPAGNIAIDGVDIASIDLMELRRGITLIPQEPAIFGGTIRENLDLEGVRTDEQLREVLDLCQMGRVFNFEPNQDPLEYHVSDLGANLSGGQIQILALSRAILAKNKIVILDEATATMDVLMTEIIHKLIQQRFRNHTLITITHHIDSALEHDKILVLHDGQVANFASPAEMLSDKNSILSQLAAETHGTTHS